MPHSIYIFLILIHFASPHRPHSSHCHGNLVWDVLSEKCVSKCPPKTKLLHKECHKVCPGPPFDIVHSKNIDSFQNCTVIHGNIAITNETFAGLVEKDSVYPPMGPSRLSVFTSVHRITGYFYISASHPLFTSLLYFQNLEVIEGQEQFLTDSLSIDESSLESINLRSLRRIVRGNVSISDNHKLCYASEINWKRIIGEGSTAVVYGNRNGRDCKESHSVCSKQCTLDGCWGKGGHNCLACVNFRLGKECVESCERSGLYQDSGVCKRCDEQCENCAGPGPGNCTSCKNVKDDLKCVEKCPVDKYEEEGICNDCDENCAGGCSGPGNNTGLNGCHFCKFTVLHVTNKQVEIFGCLGKDDECPNGFRFETVGVSEGGLLRPWAGLDVCKCEGYRNGMECVEECPKGFEARKVSRECYPKTESESSNAGVIVGVILAILIVGAIIFAYFFWYRKRKPILTQFPRLAKGRAPRPSCPSTQPEEMPLKPIENIYSEPNMSRFRVVREESLIRSDLLGSGAFGKVFRGTWIVDKMKIPVAIKVLKVSGGESKSKEFLDEAYIMASVEHPSLLKLLAICVASELQIITQLMPLGCLKTYVKKSKLKINSETMMTWSLQIAQGMEYLENHQIVHRDLAARNVLVQTPTQVKITDFGLAKLLDESEYKAGKEKLPVKWLAVECFTDKIFSHKTDVWAFGVTIWELLTFGDDPYPNVKGIQMLSLLEKGERLPQPEICTLNLYMILIQTWMKEPDDRPDFPDLVKRFNKMCVEPRKYLAIPGDGQIRLSAYTPKDEYNLLKQMSCELNMPIEEEESREEYLDARLEEYLKPENNVVVGDDGYLVGNSEQNRNNLNSPLSKDLSHDKV